jgi:hypothetical protein
LGTYDGILGLDADEGIVKHGSQVGIFCGADAGEVVDQRSVEEAEFVVHVLEPLLKRLEFGMPVFSDEEQVVSRFLADVVNLEKWSDNRHNSCKSCQAYPLVQESLREVSDGVKTEAGKTKFLDDPRTPVLDIGLDFWMRVVQVGALPESASAV